MPRISNFFLIAMLSLVPAALADRASAFVQLAEMRDDLLLELVKLRMQQAEAAVQSK